jgi:hypothetical protein
MPLRGGCGLREAASRRGTGDGGRGTEDGGRRTEDGGRRTEGGLREAGGGLRVKGRHRFDCAAFPALP